MAPSQDKIAVIKKWAACLKNTDTTDIVFKDVILCLSNVGLLQLQLQSPTAATVNPHISQLDNILEELYCDVSHILRQNFPLDHYWENSSGAPLLTTTTQLLSLKCEDKVVTRKLQCIVNAAKLTVAGSIEASKKFHNSNFLHFLQMIDDVFVHCPWHQEVRFPLSSCAFIYECPDISMNQVYSLIDDCEIKKSISTLLKLDDLISKAGFGPNSTLRLEEDGNQVIKNPPIQAPDIWTVDLTIHRYHSDSMKLQFEYDREKNEFFCPKLIRGIYHKLKLADLTTTIKPYSRFPCVNFSFVKGTIASPDIQGFLNAHGTQIKILQLNMYCEPEYFRCDKPVAMPSPTQLVTLLTQQAPEMQTLILQGFPKKWISLSNYYEKLPLRIFPTICDVKLNKLKILQFLSIPPKDLVRELMTVAVNLKHIFGIQSIVNFIATGKFYLLRELTWEVYIGQVGHNQLQVKEFDTLNEQFKSDSSISNLRKLGIFVHMFDLNTVVPPSLNCLVSKIIEGSASTLQSFHLMGHMGIFHDLLFPVLPQVQELLLTSRPQYASSSQLVSDPIPFFPPGFVPAQVFPALHKITIGFITMTKVILRWDDCFGNCFKNSPLLVTVKCLEIQEFRDLPQGWLENLAVVCPCVEDMNVKTILYNFPEDAVKGVWNFKKLKSLKLKINIWANENKFPAIDRVFTGFSNETCLELFNGIGQTNLENIRGLRAHASLLDLKELTRLHLTFVDIKLNHKIRKHPIITEVTGKYSFQMCPQLKVCIEAEGRTPELSLKLMQDLEPMFPYVHPHIPNNRPSEHFKHIPGYQNGNFYNDVVSLAKTSHG